MNTVNCQICGSEFESNSLSCPNCGFRPEPDSYLPQGTKLHGDKYTVGKVLGQGGFGITYKGSHTVLQRPVAIKEMFPEGSSRVSRRVIVPSRNQDTYRREAENILQEARLIASLKSMNIVDVYDMFRENETVYIVMEFLEGKTLEDTGRIPENQVRRIADHLCEALQEVHNCHLLHRDIKPANVILTRSGRTVLIDFGSARQFRLGRTAQHTRIFTPGYAAPEQFSSAARFGPYTDVFGLGATLFYALTGTAPADVLDRLQDPALSIALPESMQHAGLGEAIRQALNLKVQDRPQSIIEFKRILDHGGHPGTSAKAAKQSNPSHSQRFRQLRAGLSLHNVTEQSNPSHSQPYVFNGITCYTPSALAAALIKDWDTAIEDWSSGYVRRWMEDVQRDDSFEHAVSQMLQEPLFIESILSDEEPLYGADCLERQLMYVLALLDPTRMPVYRGIPLQHQESLRAWLKENQRDSSHRDVLEYCIVCAIPLVLQNNFFHELYQETHREAAVAIHLLENHLDDEDFANRSKQLLRNIYGDIIIFCMRTRNVETLCRTMQADRKAMKVDWFKELVEQAPSSAGTAAVLETLQPIARIERNNTIQGLSCLLFVVLAVAVGIISWIS